MEKTWTLASVIDDVLWSDCHSCRYIRLGIALAAITLPLAFGLYEYNYNKGLDAELDLLAQRLADLHTELLLID